MVDFLKAHPFISMEEYKWELNPALVRIMNIDNTHVHYMSEKEAKKQNAKVINNADDLMNDLGMNIDFGKNKNLKIIK